MKERKKNILYLVFPCYNEEEMLTISTKEIEKKMTKLIKDGKISKDSKVLLVDDGSKDKTWSMIEDLNKQNKLFMGVKLSRNCGQQNALLAGLSVAKEKADMAITMDVDLQDDINVVDKMVEEYENGSEIVYGVRSSRKKDSFFKRVPALAFYKFMRFMGIELVYNHSECRLMSKRAIEELEKFTEVNMFLRGILPKIGFKTSIAYYERQKRVAGETKYSVKKLIKLALECVTSFSIKPLTLVTFLGIMVSIVSAICFVGFGIADLLGKTIMSSTYIICSIWLACGVQVTSLGVVGGYIGKIYNETKRRPRYIIEKELD